MKKLLKNIKSERGSFSILFVIIIFIAMIVITGYLDILSKTWTLNEIQSYMDVAGPPSLREGVDHEKLRAEVFEVNSNLVEWQFKKIVTESMNQNPKVKSFSFYQVNVKKYTPDKWGQGETSKDRPYAIIDSIVKVRVESSFFLDTVPILTNSFYDARGNDNFTITYNGRANDGQIELIIRSVSRVVYR